MLAHRFRKELWLRTRILQWRLSHAVDPRPVAPLAAAEQLPVPLTVVLVYRRRNAATVAGVLSPLSSDPRADLRLWALDEVAPELADLTRGSGPGGKFPLVTQLLDAAPIPPDSYVAVCDDDVVFARGGWGQLLQLVVDGGFDLAQPAHDRPVNFSHWLTVRKARSVARRTRFVEIGPVFVIGPALLDAVRSDMREADMGWGLEATWFRRSHDGARLGILDAVTVDHLAYPGTAYSNEAAEAELAARMAGAGVRSLRSLRVVEQRWSPRRTQPPW